MKFEISEVDRDEVAGPSAGVAGPDGSALAPSDDFGNGS